MVVAYGTAMLHTGDVRERTRGIVAKYYPGSPELTDAHMVRIFSRDETRVLIEVAPHVLHPRRLDDSSPVR
jgi:hypothetical protein